MAMRPMLPLVLGEKIDSGFRLSSRSVVDRPLWHTLLPVKYFISEMFTLFVVALADSSAVNIYLR